MSWNVVAASVRGASHERADLECQDAHLWTLLRPGVLVAAVADGAGSARLGHIGARVATAAAVGATTEREAFLSEGAAATWKTVLEDGIASARLAVEMEATALGCPSGELATTLILVLASRTLVGVAQIGDGAAVVLDDDEGLITLTTPQTGEYINETVFLTSPAALERAQVILRPGSPTRLAVFSDALQLLALKMPHAIPHEAFFLPLFRFVDDQTDLAEAESALAGFLRSRKVTDRVDDDVTLLLASALR